jgi:transcriptional regulator of arginine metabolism
VGAMAISEVKMRLEALKHLLEEGELSTQEELREKLEKINFDVTQSTVSRDLRKLGAVRTADSEGRTVYRLHSEREPVIPSDDVVREIDSNGALIVIHTAVGCANLVARQLDRDRPDEILGTIAGDDTIFVAPSIATKTGIRDAIHAIYSCLNLTD